jgi:hypothetical protein
MVFCSLLKKGTVGFIMLKIMLWRNSSGAKAMSHPGHVALAIGAAEKPEHYISYWPAEDSGGTPVSSRPAKFNRLPTDLQHELGRNARARLTAGATPRPGQVNDLQVVVGGFEIPNPNQLWVKIPEQIIELPIIDKDHSIGLSQESIVDWWRIFSSSDLGFEHRYRFISRKLNCASIVMSALLVGGSRMFVKPDRQFMYYAPNDVAKYARQLIKKIDKMRRSAVAVAEAPVNPGVTTTTVSLAGPEIWRPDAWRKMSAVRIGRRHSQVAQIDIFVRQYWEIGDHWTVDNCHQKAMQLYQMLIQIQDHLASKPKSDRRAAVLQLGRRCLEVIKDRAEYDDEMKVALQYTVKKDLM